VYADRYCDLKYAGNSAKSTFIEIRNKNWKGVDMKNHIQEDVWLYCRDVALTSSTGARRVIGATTLESIVVLGSAAIIGSAGFYVSLYLIR
jgi:hypothetical protein